MSDAAHLLPPNSTKQERDISRVIAASVDVPVLVRESWNPATCPAQLLPWLAWAFSVDEWQAGWTEAEQRAVIQNALFVHQHKGTLAALKRAVEPLGYIIKITEWQAEQDTAAPFSFRLDVGVTDKGVNETIYQQIERLVVAYKNVRSYMRALTIKAEINGTAFFAAGLMSGVDTVVYPYISEDMESIAAMTWAAFEQSVDTVSIRPRLDAGTFNGRLTYNGASNFDGNFD